MIIAPSVLSADFGNLQRDIEMLNRSRAGLLHLDIMDGLFVPNISYGFPVLKAIAAHARKPMDAHLMIQDPDRYIRQFADLGVSWLSVHYEACTHLHRSLGLIRDCGMKAGVALNPHTPVSLVEDVLENCDFVLIMSVNPGFGGQRFIPRATEKIRSLKRMIRERSLDTLVEVDGGVNFDNAPRLSAAGADVAVAGNTVFSAADPEEAIRKLSEA